MDEDKKLAGQVILEHDAQGLDLEDDVREYRKSMEPEIIELIWDTIDKAKHQDLYIDRDFYVVLMQSSDRVLRQPKNIYLVRRSCPTPVFKQSVWKYHYQTGSLEFLWSIPEAVRYYHIVHNPNQYLIDKGWADVAKMVILMESGELLQWVKKENGEKIDAVIKINSEETKCLIN